MWRAHLVQRDTYRDGNMDCVWPPPNLVVFVRHCLVDVDHECVQSIAHSREFLFHPPLRTESTSWAPESLLSFSVLWWGMLEIHWAILEWMALCVCPIDWGNRSRMRDNHCHRIHSNLAMLRTLSLVPVSTPVIDRASSSARKGKHRPRCPVMREEEWFADWDRLTKDSRPCAPHRWNDLLPWICSWIYENKHQHLSQRWHSPRPNRPFLEEHAIHSQRSSPSEQ